MTKIGDLGYEHANYTERFVSACLDWVIIIIIMPLALLVGVLMALLVAWLGEKHLPFVNSETYWVITIILCPFVAYYFLWHRLFRKTGQTFGMMIMKIKSIPAYGSKISWFASISRLFLCGAFFGILFLFRSNQPNQSIIDDMSGTYTIKVKKTNNP